jgi:hypothetical protein
MTSELTHLASERSIHQSGVLIHQHVYIRASYCSETNAVINKALSFSEKKKKDRHVARSREIIQGGILSYYHRIPGLD